MLLFFCILLTIRNDSDYKTTLGTLKFQLYRFPILLFVAHPFFEGHNKNERNVLLGIYFLCIQ